jgi:hypothetical protein
LADEPIRDLGKQSRAIAAASVGVHATAVCQPLQGLQRSLHDFVRSPAAKLGDETHSASVVVNWDRNPRHLACVPSKKDESTIQNFDDGDGFFERRDSGGVLSESRV